MLPIPTPTAFAAVVGALLTLGLGAGLGSWPVTVLGGAALVGLALCLAMTMPLGRRVRRHRLEFAWWLAHAEPGSGGGAVVPGKPFEVRCFMRHRGSMRLRLLAMTPLAPGGAKLTGEDGSALELGPNARTEFTFRLIAPAVGRVVMHGLAVTLPGPLGLFELPLYFPNPLVIKVLPRAALRTRSAPRTITGLPVERSGASLLSPAGSGTELRELRELRPGDPFKSIAWKASARRGRLMVREVEQEVQETRYVIVDVSGTMRGGEPGARKLDFAVEAAASEARRTLDAGDRIGLITVDGRLLGHVAPQDGRPQLLRVFENLISAIEAVDEDLTDVDDDEVVAVVGRYVRQQDGVDFHRDGGQGWNVPMLVRHVQEALEDAEDRVPVRASSPAGEVLRRFCRVRGIPLPYRPDPRDGLKGPGLAAALREAGGRSRTPMSIVAITDFDGTGSFDELTAAAKLLRMHGHGLSFIVPDATTFGRPAEGGPAAREVFAVYERTERRRFREARERFLKLGVAVLPATADDNPAIVVARAQRAMRRRKAA